MLIEFLPFQIPLNTVAIAGACLWSLALYLSLAFVREKIVEGLDRWFNFAERSLYASQQEFERTRAARESQNAFYASLLSIIPFLVMGGLCNWGLEASLGRSWSVSVGIIACAIGGVYELGRRQGES